MRHISWASTGALFAALLLIQHVSGMIESSDRLLILRNNGRQHLLDHVQLCMMHDGDHRAPPVAQIQTKPCKRELFCRGKPRCGQIIGFFSKRFTFVASTPITTEASVGTRVCEC